MANRKSTLAGGWDENAVMDVIDKKDAAKEAYDKAMGTMSGATLYATTVDTGGDEISIAAGPRMPTPGAPGSFIDGDTGTDIATGVLTAAGLGILGYGAYKAASGLADSPGKPWLYKLNPAYWIKPAAERRYIDIEKSRGKQNVALNTELAAAERAYYTDQAAAQKEGQIAQFEQGLQANKALATAPAAPAPAPAPAPQGGTVSGYMGNAFVGNAFVGAGVPGANPVTDKKVLSAIKASGLPLTPGSVLTPAEADKMEETILAAFGGDEGSARKWATAFLERMQISWTGSDGSIRAWRGGRVVVMAPPAPADVSMRTSAASSVHGDAARTRVHKRGTVDLTLMPTEDSTEDTTEFSTLSGWGGHSHRYRGRRPGTVMSTIMPTTMSTTMSTVDSTLSGVWGPHHGKKGKGKGKGRKHLGKMSGWTGRHRGRRHPGTVMPTTMSTVDRTSMRTTFPMSGDVNPVDTLINPSSSVVSQNAKAVSLAVQQQGARIATIANQLGLAGKKQWTAQDRDKIAAALLKMMMTSQGQAPTASDAAMAREVIKIYGGSHGVLVAGDIYPGDAVVGGQFVAFNPVGDEMGLAWYDVASLGIIPAAKLVAKGAVAAGKGIVSAAKWVGRGFKGAPSMTPQQRNQQIIAAAAQRKAAAAARILAAEKKQDAAIQAQNEAAEAAKAQSDAEAAEAAANEAEAVATEASAMQNVPETPQVLQDLGISGMSGCGVSKLGAWAVLGQTIVPVGKAAQVAATPTKAGKAVRKGAAIARAAKTSPAVKKKVQAVAAAAKAGDKKAKKAIAVVKTGALADAQRTDALVRDAVAKRTLADRFKIAVTSAINLGKPLPAWRPWPPFRLATGPVAMGNAFVGDSLDDEMKYYIDPAYHTNRLSKTATRWEATRHLVPLKPTQTALGDDIDDELKFYIDPAYHTNRLSKSAARWDVTRNLVPLKPTQTALGLSFVGAAKAAKPAKPSAALLAQVPPPIPGEPTDVLVATTASANTMGVPPAVAASVIAAAKAGDKGAKKELADAKKVWTAAQKGDPMALKQIAAVKKDHAAGYAPASQKAAALAAAAGHSKGWTNWKTRKAKEADMHIDKYTATLINASSAAGTIGPKTPSAASGEKTLSIFQIGTGSKFVNPLG